MHNVFKSNNLNTMKLFLGLITTILLGSSVFSQDTEWKLYSSVDGVEIYTMESDCYAKNIPDQKAIIIKVVNTTGQNVAVEWDKVIWYNDELVTKNVSDGENHMKVEVAKNSSEEGNCEVPYGALYIYKDFITYKTDTKLSKFELQNIKVIRL